MYQKQYIGTPEEIAALRAAVKRQAERSVRHLFSHEQVAQLIQSRRAVQGGYYTDQPKDGAR